MVRVTVITRISSLRDCGVFRNFTWPLDLPEFRRYNLIYGWNASGKTTLSRILRALETRTAPATGQVTVGLDGRDVRGEEFAQATLLVRVFNHDFMAESVFPIGGGDLPPIFVLGAESVEKQREVERLKGERATAQSKLDSARSKKQGAERGFDQYCIDRAKVTKDTLRSSGQNAYNNYNKTDFQRDAQKMAAVDDGTSHRLSDAEREKALAQHRATPKPKVQEVTYALPDFDALIAGLSQLLTTTVVSAAIQALKDDPTLAEWTREGLGLHRDRKAERCLFCEQPLPKGRLAALEAHFSAQYEQFMQRLDQQIVQFQSASKQASELKLPNRAELYDDLGAEYDGVEAGLREAASATGRFLDAAAMVLAEKKGRVFESVAFSVPAPAVDGEAGERLNMVIRKHNQACDEFQSRVADARKRLALDMIAPELGEFNRLQDTTRHAAADLQAAEQNIQRLTSEIERSEREIVEHRQPAEQLNADLHKYLGHDELCLAIKETGYTITRNGTPAKSLSEGETTAIALLYFLKSLQDRRFDLTHGIVVLDDPVSSLDQNALFAAFGYIRARTQSAAQVFVLTHNFTFFRLVREWFRNLRGQEKSGWRVYMLESSAETTGRCARIRKIDALLMDYESEYHYLFSRVCRLASRPRAACLEPYYCAPSMARRVLETFLSFRVPNLGGHNRLWGQMSAIQFDEEKKSRIYRFLQTHAHRDVIGESDEDLTLLAESPSVLTDMLEFMRKADMDHVSAMEKLITAPPDPGGG